MHTVLGVMTDLMFVVRVGDAVRKAGNTPVFVGTPERARAQAEQNPALVIVDLGCTTVDTTEVIREAKARGLKVVAFGSHVDVEQLRTARDAGADQVMLRSKFVEQLNAIVNV